VSSPTHPIWRQLARTLTGSPRDGITGAHNPSVAMAPLPTIAVDSDLIGTDRTDPAWHGTVPPGHSPRLGFGRRLLHHR